jgi:hypothetical protein
MSEAYAAMQNMIGKLRELGQSPETIAADLAPDLETLLGENIASGIGPDGTPWAPTQEGHIPLQGAAGAMGVAAMGNKVLAALRGIHARHHYGQVRGKIARPILPTSDLPPKIVDLITKVATQRFRLIMGGG